MPGDIITSGYTSHNTAEVISFPTGEVILHPANSNKVKISGLLSKEKVSIKNNKTSYIMTVDAEANLIPGESRPFLYGGVNIPLDKRVYIDSRRSYTQIFEYSGNVSVHIGILFSGNKIKNPKSSVKIYSISFIPVLDLDYVKTDLPDVITAEKFFTENADFSSISISGVDVTGNVTTVGLTGPIGPTGDISNWSMFPATSDVICDSLYYSNLVPSVSNSYSILYVSITGDDDIGTGAQNFPFATLSKAMEVVNSDINRYAIMLMPGSHYNAPISITKNVTISGLPNIYSQTSTSITCNFEINIIPGPELYNTQVVFSNLLINGGITDISLGEHTLGFESCYIYTSNYAILQESSVDTRTRIKNCLIKQESSGSSSAAALVDIRSGKVEILLSDIAANGSSLCLGVTGSANVLKIGNSIFENDSDVSLCLMSISCSDVVSISYCAFVYNTLRIDSGRFGINCMATLSLSYSSFYLMGGKYAINMNGYSLYKTNNSIFPDGLATGITGSSGINFILI